MARAAASTPCDAMRKRFAMRLHETRDCYSAKDCPQQLPCCQQRRINDDRSFMGIPIHSAVPLRLNLTLL